MDVLITGGFGYLGGRVAQFLSEKGYHVTLSSRNELCAPEWLQTANVVQLNWENEDKLKEVCNDFDVVLHAAAINANECAQNPVKALEFNGLATARLVKASREAGVSKFIYFSTAHVYRSPLVGEFNSATCPDNKHPYATSHLAGENAVIYESNLSNDFCGTVLRISNAIGAPAYKGANCWMLVANDLCKQVVINGSMQVLSNPFLERDYVPISLVSSFIGSILEEKGYNKKINNVSSGSSLTLVSLCEIIRKVAMETLGIEVETIFKSINNKADAGWLVMNSDLFAEERIMNDHIIEREVEGLLKSCDMWFG